MSKFIAFFKLIRLPNLLMVILAQYICALKFVQFIEMQQMILIFVATVFIAMGGYVLNDLEDLKIDAVNNKTLVTEFFNPSFLKKMSYFFSIIGLVVAGFLSFKSYNWFIILFVFAFFLLWSYAKFFSKFKLIGNILVSVLVAESIFIVPVIANISNQTSILREDVYIVVLPSYILLAFLFNWMREIIKDLEDQKGDESENRITAPSVFGTEPTKSIVYALILMASPLIVLQLYKLHYNLLAFVIVLIFFLIYKLKIAKVSKDFKQVSLLMKIIMLLGILYPLF